MATISNTPRPGYVWDSTDNVWYPIGVGGHSHPDYITQATAVNPTLIDAKGDIITATAADTPARLAVGANGETLVADSAATTGLRYSATPSASNPVINSAMQVWQRGTSFSLAASTAYTSGFTADRWQTATNANQACTISRQATSDTTNLPNIQYALRYQRNSGQTGTGTITLGQSFESINSIPFVGKTVTVSYYARAGANYSPTSSVLAGYLITGTGTDQNIFSTYTGVSYAITGNATLTTTWQRFTFTGTIGSTVTELGVAFNYVPTGTAGAADYFEVTGVQIDIGSVALPFRTYAATIQGELAACQRYYFVKVAAGTQPATFGMASYIASNDLRGTFGFPVEMRVTPTLVATSGTNYYKTEMDNDQFNSVTLNWTTKTEAGWYNSGDTASGTKGQASMVGSNNALSSIALSAEL